VAAADLLYGIVLALVLGALGGYAFGCFIKWLQPRHVLAPEFDGFLVIGAVLAGYVSPTCSTPTAWSRCSWPVSSSAATRSSTSTTSALHRSATIAKHFAELGVILLLGTLVTGDAFGAPGWAGG
jgi:NhaP-type Na+/H+ or K+/H+ antiporter